VHDGLHTHLRYGIILGCCLLWFLTRGSHTLSSVSLPGKKCPSASQDGGALGGAGLRGAAGRAGAAQPPVVQSRQLPDARPGHRQPARICSPAAACRRQHAPGECRPICVPLHLALRSTGRMLCSHYKPSRSRWSWCGDAHGHRMTRSADSSALQQHFKMAGHRAQVSAWLHTPSNVNGSPAAATPRTPESPASAEMINGGTLDSSPPVDSSSPPRIDPAAPEGADDAAGLPKVDDTPVRQAGQAASPKVPEPSTPHRRCQEACSRSAGDMSCL
jgi:hypothetical protein